MSARPPCVTCVVPVHNGERFLAATLESIALQKRRPDRLVILDNCSTDRTGELIQQCIARHPELRVEWRRHEKNLGSLVNFNLALDYAAETEFLHLISHDDLLEPDFFARLVPTLENVPGRALAYCGLTLINERDEVTRPYLGPKGHQPMVLSRERFLAQQSELNNVYCQTVLLRTAYQPPPIHFLAGWQQAADVVFFAEWAMHCEKIVAVPEPLCRYRQHPASASGANSANLQAWVLEEWRAMQTVSALISESDFRRWLRRQKLKCVFGARSRVKMKQMQPQNPAYAEDIGIATRTIVSPLHWILGGAAVVLRDGLCLLRTMRGG